MVSGKTKQNFSQTLKKWLTIIHNVTYPEQKHIIKKKQKKGSTGLRAQ